jgi:hypothetical protein
MKAAINLHSHEEHEGDYILAAFSIATSEVDISIHFSENATTSFSSLSPSKSF